MTPTEQTEIDKAYSDGLDAGMKYVMRTNEEYEWWEKSFAHFAEFRTSQGRYTDIDGTIAAAKEFADKALAARRAAFPKGKP